jgi:heat shock protein HslJ
MTRFTRWHAASAAMALLLVPAAAAGADGSAAPSVPAASAGPHTHAPVEATRWHLHEYRSEDGGMAGAYDGAWMTLRDGLVTGDTGCGTIAGRYALEGDALTLSELSVGVPPCAGDSIAQEMALVGRLPDVASYAFDGGDLWLVDATGGQHLMFIALQGRTWVPMYGGAEPMPAAIVTLAFGPTGVSGQGPCNSYAGPFTQDGASIAIGPLESTRMACPDLELENEFLADLQVARSYAIESGDLVLFDDQGGETRRFAESSTGD